MRRPNACDWNLSSNGKNDHLQDQLCHEEHFASIHDTIDPHQTDFGPEAAYVQSLKTSPTAKNTTRSCKRCEVSRYPGRRL
jgi:hypothetical protein